MSNKLFIFIAFAVLIVLSAHTALAQTTISPYDTERLAVFGTGNDPITFLSKWLYPGLIAAATILAVIMIIFAGFQWMAGAVSPPQVNEAKSRIYSALWGLGLALGSWMILYIINPNLVALRIPQVQEPAGAAFVKTDTSGNVTRTEKSDLTACQQTIQNDLDCGQYFCSCDYTYTPPVEPAPTDVFPEIPVVETSAPSSEPVAPLEPVEPAPAGSEITCYEALGIYAGDRAGHVYKQSSDCETAVTASYGSYEPGACSAITVTSILSCPE